uniref:Vacuolar protein sorting-associated protein 54 n=1 Tax=Ascaris suum TaxID=6253 RepID=F1KS34_ASCSU
METASWSSVTNTCARELFADAGYPRHCDICPPSITFADRFEMAHHLRRVHSTREGGSFICRYGPNGICQTLPLEGVSDRDYEAHLRKCHISAASASKVSPNAPSNEEIADAKNRTFTVHSFTQNLSSVLSDPKRPRSEVHSFFTRHWGDSFVPKIRVSSSSSLPSIDVDHFRNYLTTTAKKHRKYLRAKKELSRCLTRREENTRIDVNDVPPILLSSHFSLADAETFEAIFLEPRAGEPDQLCLHEVGCSSSEQSSASPGSDSLSSRQTVNGRAQKIPEAFDAGRGRAFRSYESLQNRLEFYQDLVDSRLNNQLAAKSNSFWKTVKSCGSLYGELGEARNKATLVRKSLHEVNEKVYMRMIKIMELYKTRQQRERLLQKLQDISCLRDAQLTVQMLLNQSDYPKALECIDTAQEVLRSDLRGIVCFRHLSSQLQELYKVIGKMLQEEFVALVQKELGRSCESEADAVCQDGQLNPIVLGLLRVNEYRFVHVLQQEIVEAIKNLLRQVIKSHVISSCRDHQLSVFDPSLGTLGNQMRRLNLDEWLAAFDHLLRVLFLMCRRVQSIQELILENIDRFGDVVPQDNREHSLPATADRSDQHFVPSIIIEQEDEGDDDVDEEMNDLLRGAASTLEKQTIGRVPSTLSLEAVPSNEAPPCSLTHSQSLACAEFVEKIPRRDSVLGDAPVEGLTSMTASTPAAMLSMPCRNLAQVRQSISLLTKHATYTAQERCCRLLFSRAKDGFLERLSVDDFQSVLRMADEFIKKCSLLVGSDANYSSPLRLCIVQQSARFIKSFHQERKAKLGNILDSENWRATEVPLHFQRIADECVRTQKLSDVASVEDRRQVTPQHSLIVDGESYVVVGTALLVLQMMSQYSDALSVLPDFASELLMCIVELLKNFNSRSCQLILGAGALQLIGLKSISVRHLALSSRCLQMVVRFAPYLRAHFERHLPTAKQNQLRHMDHIVRDYKDHIDEITNKLISVIEHHTLAQLQQWEVKSSTPSAAFQQICRQLGKFYNGLTGIMPESMIKDLFLRVHEGFKVNLKQQLAVMGITPHDSLTYGLVSQDYSFYVKSVQALPCCSDFKDQSISEALYAK